MTLGTAKFPSLSVFIPAYNDAPSLPELIAKVVAATKEWLFYRGCGCETAAGRLIRRVVLDRIRLSSTSGTICVELVRKIELTGCGVEEVGVHHYPRVHGTSQFFRVKLLLKTLFELVRLWMRVVVFS